MKKLLILFTLIPFATIAQELSLGGKFGFNIPTASSYVTSSGILFGGRVFASLEKFETGLDFEAGSYQAKGIFVSGSVHSVHASAVYNILQAFANYKIVTTQGFDIYAGLSMGVDFGEAGGRSAVLVDKNTGHKASFYSVNSFNNAFSFGLQAGVRYYIINAFSVQAEVAARTSFLNNGNGFSYTPVYFPVSLGVNARLFKF